MILDKRNEFADATSVAGAAAPTTALIGDAIDLEALGITSAGLGNPGDIGNGQPIYFYISVDTSIITAGAAGTIEFQLVSDAQAAIAVDGSATVHYRSRAFVTDDDALNDLDAGDLPVMIALPLEGPVYERYLGVLVTRTTTAVSAGAISAGLTLDPHGWRAYPEGVN